MKEATGELAGSVIVVAAVAVLTVFFFTIVWPMIKSGMQDRATCANAICDIGYLRDGDHKYMAQCYSPADSGKTIFYCPFKG